MVEPVAAISAAASVITALGGRPWKWVKNKFVRKKRRIHAFVVSSEPQRLCYTGEERTHFKAERERLEQLLYETPEPERSRLAAEQHKTLNELKTKLNRLKHYEHRAEDLEFLHGRIAEIKVLLHTASAEQRGFLQYDLQRREIQLREFWDEENLEPQYLVYRKARERARAHVAAVRRERSHAETAIARRWSLREKQEFVRTLRDAAVLRAA